MRHLCSVVVVLQMAILAHGSQSENITSNSIVTTTEEPKPNFKCFFEPAESCPEKGWCKFLTPNNDTAICCNMNHFEFKEEITALQNKYSLRRLHIWNTNMTELQLNRFMLSSLESIAFTDGRVDKVTVLPRQNGTYLLNLQCLNLSSNHLNEVDKHLVEDMPTLKQLDLSFNNLSNLSIIPPTNGSNNADFYLDISNNAHLWCNNITDIKDDMQNKSFNLRFRNQETTTCVVPRDYWFKFYIQIKFQQLESLQQTQEYCFKNTPCTCLPYRVRYNEEEVPSLGFSVNCTGRNLTSLPEVPQHTIVLDVSNNNISNLKKVKTDHNYHKLIELHARSNQISSMQDIEGSDFLRDFQVLDIRDNKLTEIQTYIFNHAFGPTRLLKNVKLAGNKVKCDCNTAQHVKMWLLKNSKYIEDYSDIRCDNFNIKLMSLDPNKVCKYPRVWTDYINYIIAGEVILLFLLISKVSYDYWVFRTAGYLPWPASKMPKMPCDFVFET